MATKITFKKAKETLINILSESIHPYSSLHSLIILSGLFTTLDDPLIAELEKDKELVMEVEKLREKGMQAVIEQSYRLALGDGSKPNDRFLSIYLKLISNDTALARLGAGGLTMSDVQQVGGEKKSINIFVDNGGNRQQDTIDAPIEILDDNKPKRGRGRPRKHQIVEPKVIEE